MLRKGIDYAGDLSRGGRSLQQDSYGFVPPDELGGERDLLLILADGMGGYSGGDVASNEAIHAFAQRFLDDEFLDDHARLLAATAAADSWLSELIQTQPGLEGMGTTLVAVLVRDQELRWASVGDSPLYRFRDGVLLRLNADHSMRAVLREQVASGQLTPQEAADHPERNHLLAALTGGGITHLDAPPEAIPLLPGDLLIACSDGVFSLEESRLARVLAVLQAEEATAIVRRILQDVQGRRKENQDNTTVAVIKIPPLVATPEPESAPTSPSNGAAPDTRT